MDIKLPEDWKLNSRGYGLNKAGFRDLPKDELIEQLWETIPNKSWKFVFGLMATYGLRNHEVFFCDLSSLTNFGDKIIRVLPTLKLGNIKFGHFILNGWKSSNYQNLEKIQNFYQRSIETLKLQHYKILEKK